MLTYCSLAVYFEQGRYDEAIETCEKAIEEGQSVSPVQCTFVFQCLTLL